MGKKIVLSEIFECIFCQEAVEFYSNSFPTQGSPVSANLFLYKREKAIIEKFQDKMNGALNRRSNPKKKELLETGLLDFQNNLHSIKQGSIQGRVVNTMVFEKKSPPDGYLPCRPEDPEALKKFQRSMASDVYDLYPKIVERVIILLKSRKASLEDDNNDLKLALSYSSCNENPQDDVRKSFRKLCDTKLFYDEDEKLYISMMTDKADPAERIRLRGSPGLFKFFLMELIGQNIQVLEYGGVPLENEKINLRKYCRAFAPFLSDKKGKPLDAVKISKYPVKNRLTGIQENTIREAVEILKEKGKDSVQRD